MILKSVRSVNLCKSPDYLGAGVILVFFYIVKAHSGELKVETKEDEGCVFVILLPINL